MIFAVFQIPHAILWSIWGIAAWVHGVTPFLAHAAYGIAFIAGACALAGFIAQVVRS